MSVKFAIVPPSFTLEQITEPSFRKKNHYYADKHEHSRLKQAHAIEPLDEARRIWRYRGIAHEVDSVKVSGVRRSGRIFTGISGPVRNLMASEITGRPMVAS